jgi:uncharacterized membrane protein YtjA (UPF0391 family)
MLKWALIFLVIALVAALLGFGGIAGGATEIAKILFFVFLVIFAISLIMPPPPIIPPGPWARAGRGAGTPTSSGGAGPVGCAMGKDGFVVEVVRVLGSY